jgi:monomeric sarcosine oxidase
MRIAVIGAGGVGSATTRFLAEEGHEVILLEQLSVDHDRGSSYGSSRIIRKTYPNALYTQLMTAAYPLWDKLERDAGEPLLVRCGGLFFAPEGWSEMTAMRDALTSNGVRFETMNANETRGRFPQFVLSPSEVSVFEHDAGFLRASACVRANVRLAVARGAELRENAAVTAIAVAASGDRVSLALDQGEMLEVDRLVVAAGPWTARLLARHCALPLTVTRQAYCHFEPSADSAAYAPERFPIWIDLAKLFYGFPIEPGAPGAKVARHVPGTPTEPDRVDRAVDESDRRKLRDYCATRLPGLSPRVLYEKVCLYTNTPDADFVIDTLPGAPAVTVVAGLSGHGFKFTVLLGRIAAWMAEGASVPYPIEAFRIARFV